MAFVYNMIYGGGGGDVALGFSVVAQADQPSSPTENMIWVETSTPMTSWAISPENPFTTFGEKNFLEGVEPQPGYFSSSGGIANQDSADMEVYTEEYFQVEYGRGYEYTYSLSTAKSMWFAIVEYKADKTFIQRLVPVNKTSAFETGSYTPSSNNVVYVRLAWRTLGDEACSVMFTTGLKDVPLDGLAAGTVWIKTASRGCAMVDISGDKNIMLCPVAARVFTESGWITPNAYVYQNNAWIQLCEHTYLYDNGDPVSVLTGGWVKKSGTLTLNNDSMKIVGSTGRVTTTNMIDLRGYKAIEFDVQFVGDTKVAQVGIGESQTSFNKYAETPKAMTEYGTVSLDVTEYQADYYVQMYTTDTTNGLLIRAVRLVK